MESVNCPTVPNIPAYLLSFFIKTRSKFVLAENAQRFQSIFVRPVTFKISQLFNKKNSDQYLLKEHVLFFISTNFPANFFSGFGLLLHKTTSGGKNSRIAFSLLPRLVESAALSHRELAK